MSLEELMEKFAEDFGVENVADDGRGVWSLDVDGMIVSFAEQKATGEMLVLADVGEVPQEGRERLYRTLLEASFLGEGTAGAVLSVKPGSDSVCLHRIVTLAEMDVERFRTMLESFVNVLESWRKLIADFGKVADDQAKSARQDWENDRKCKEDGFLRV